VTTSEGNFRVGDVRSWRRSLSEAISLSSISAASWPAVIHAGEFQRSFNLHRRPFQRSGVALFGGFEASGVVPSLEFDGGIFDLLLIGGERKGPDYNLRFPSEVLSAFTMDLYAILDFMGSFVIFCTPTVWY
jgi:hypothetical protein